MSDCHETPASSHAAHWALDPAIAMLNHGSFGACPREVLEVQQRLRAELESRPVEFLTCRMQPLLDESRADLARLVGADPANLVFVSNVTAGVNSVLRSLRFEPGDELLVTDHEYNACRNVASYTAQRSGATIVAATIPLPIESPQAIIEAVMQRVTERTRLVVLDHVTSPTAVIFPAEEIVRRLECERIDVLVDGAHAPGMLPLDIRRMGAAYYAGNCHKWLCGPKAAGFLYVRPDRQDLIQPPVISHGYNTPRPGRSRFQDAFDWQGTHDPTPWLCVGAAIRFLGALHADGLTGLMRHNHELATWARRMLCQRLGLRPVCPEEMIGSMAALELSDDLQAIAARDTAATPMLPHWLVTHLRDSYGVEVPVYHWPAAPRTLLRISAQAYNSRPQYERLAAALEAIRRCRHNTLVKNPGTAYLIIGLAGGARLVATCRLPSVRPLVSGGNIPTEDQSIS